MIFKKTNKKCVVDVAVYNFNIHIYVGTPEYGESEFKKTIYYSQGEELNFKEKYGTTVREGNDSPFVWINNTYGRTLIISTLAHELIHVLTYKLLRKRIPIDDEHNETFAYPMGFCMKEAMEKLKL